jgi:hypothetical protein
MRRYRHQSQQPADTRRHDSPGTTAGPFRIAGGLGGWGDAVGGALERGDVDSGSLSERTGSPTASSRPPSRSSTPVATPGTGCLPRPAASDPCVRIPGSNRSRFNQVGITWTRPKNDSAQASGIPPKSALSNENSGFNVRIAADAVSGRKIVVALLRGREGKGRPSFRNTLTVWQADPTRENVSQCRVGFLSGARCGLRSRRARAMSAARYARRRTLRARRRSRSPRQPIRV